MCWIWNVEEGTLVKEGTTLGNPARFCSGWEPTVLSHTLHRPLPPTITMTAGERPGETGGNRRWKPRRTYLERQAGPTPPSEMSQAIRHLELPFYRLSSYPNWTPTATANLTSLRIQVDAKMMDTWVALGSPSMENYLTSLVSFPFVVTALTRQTFTSTLFNNENRSF